FLDERSGLDDDFLFGRDHPAVQHGLDSDVVVVRLTLFQRRRVETPLGSGSFDQLPVDKEPSIRRNIDGETSRRLRRIGHLLLVDRGWNETRGLTWVDPRIGPGAGPDTFAADVDGASAGRREEVSRHTAGVPVAIPARHSS